MHIVEVARGERRRLSGTIEILFFPFFALLFLRTFSRLNFMCESVIKLAATVPWQAGKDSFGGKIWCPVPLATVGLWCALPASFFSPARTLHSIATIIVTT